MPESEISTYTNGLVLKTTQPVTKNDIITLCNLLNERDEYKDVCTFEPEPITEGGIVYRFNVRSPEQQRWYKSVRLGIGNCPVDRTGEFSQRFLSQNRGKWDWIHHKTNVMEEWNLSKDIVYPEHEKFRTFLKSFRGAPAFTQEELKIWEECLACIGVQKVGKIPTKKDLKFEDELKDELFVNQ